jgi:hypothetical protein
LDTNSTDFLFGTKFAIFEIQINGCCVGLAGHVGVHPSSQCSQSSAVGHYWLTLCSAAESIGPTGTRANLAAYAAVAVAVLVTT